MFASICVCDTKYSKFAGYCFFLIFSLSFHSLPRQWRIFYASSLVVFLSDSLWLCCLYNELIAARVFSFPNQNVDKQTRRKAATFVHKHTEKKAKLIIFAFYFLVMFRFSFSTNKTLDNFLMMHFFECRKIPNWKCVPGLFSLRRRKKLWNCNLLNMNEAIRKNCCFPYADNIPNKSNSKMCHLFRFTKVLIV